MKPKEKKAIILTICVITLAVAPNVSVQVADAKEVKYTGWGNRDPLDNSIVLEKIEVPKDKKGIAFPKENFLVTAVVWGSERPQAIINGKLIAVGDMLNDGKVTGIDKEGVHLNFEGEEVTLLVK